MGILSKFLTGFVTRHVDADRSFVGGWDMYDDAHGDWKPKRASVVERKLDNRSVDSFSYRRDDPIAVGSHL